LLTTHTSFHLRRTFCWSQAEAAKTTLFLDLPEDRLDDRLAHLVHGASGLGS
jgi:hypothetical protein